MLVGIDMKLKLPLVRNATRAGQDRIVPPSNLCLSSKNRFNQEPPCARIYPDSNPTR